ncbi:MAG: hypothetical protein JNL08_03700 [Planctomycetes bacterium]|nr:hypothetical protein [Planctomycetota bacterium]
MLRTVSTSLFAAAVLATGMPGQAPATSHPVPLPTAQQRAPIAAGLATPDGRPTELWASGRGYKVSFHDGMVFRPRVGPTLPHQPLRWRTVSVRAGDHELLPPAAAATPPTPRWSEFRCEYDLGPVTERYDVRDDGVEQSFVVPVRPPAGPLVVRGELTTPLVLAPREARCAGLTLCLPDGRPAVEYGAAVAIDAHGVRTPVAIATDGRHVELQLAAETVAAAAFPLVIDPVIAPNTLLAIGAAIDDVDVLHETLSDPNLQARTWFTWTDEFAAGDADLRLWRLGDGFAGTVIEVFREISTYSSSRQGRIALAPGIRHVVLVWQYEDPTSSRIYFHRHSVDDVTWSPAAFPLTGAAGTSDWRPDVGGRIGTTGSLLLVTFQRELVSPLTNTANSEVWATLYDAQFVAPGLGASVPPFPVLVRPNADQERPVVNQSAVGDHWLVAFQESNNNVTNDDWDVTTVAIAGSGIVTPTGLETASDADPLVHAITPEIAGAGGRYLLTYTTRAFELPNPKPAGRLGSTLWAQRLDFDHATGTGTLPHAAVALLGAATNTLDNGGLAFDVTSRSHWNSTLLVQSTDRYRSIKVGYTGNIVESLVLAPVFGAEPSAIATTFDEGSRRFPIVFAETDSGGGAVAHGTTHDYVAVQPPTLLGFACGGGVWADLDGIAARQQVGSEGMPLRLENAPEDSLAFVMIATAAANVPGSLFGAPGCTIVPDIFTSLITLIPAPIQNGHATVRVDLPELAGPVGLCMQWGYFVTGANPLGIQASEGLRVDVDR